MIKKILILCLFFILNFTRAQSNNNFSIIQKGIEASYKFQLKKADSLFFNYIKYFPKSPAGYHYLSQLHLWYYLGSRDETERIIFEKYSQLALEKTETLLDEQGNEANTHFLLGQIYTLRALGQIFQDKSISALFSSRNAVSEFEETLDIDSTYYDAYYGIGLFNYVLSFVPDKFKWAIAIAGLDADKEKGLKNMGIAYRRGKFMKSEAGFQLSQIYADYIAEHDSSLALLNELTEKYPQNLIFNYEKCVVLIKSHKLDFAEKLLKKISNHKYKQFSQTNALINFQLGNIYYFKNRFKTALIYFNRFLNDANSLDFTGIAHYRMAISYYFLNDKLESKHELLLAGQGNEDIELDKYAKKMSMELFDSWLSKDRQKLIITENNLRAGNYKAIIDSLQNSISNFSDGELKNTARVYLADAFIKNDSFNSAFAVLLKIKKEDFEKGSWVIPYSKLLFAEYYYLKMNYQKSNEYLDLAEENDEYENEEDLSVRIMNLKRKLRKFNKKL